MNSVSIIVQHLKKNLFFQNKDIFFPFFSSLKEMNQLSECFAELPKPLKDNPYILITRGNTDHKTLEQSQPFHIYVDYKRYRSLLMYNMNTIHEIFQTVQIH